MKLPFGKYKDQDIDLVPLSYLEWLTNGAVKIEKWLENDINDEIKRRQVLKSKSSIGNVVTYSEDTSIQYLYGIIKKMPDSLFNRPLILDKKYRILIQKVQQ